MKLLKNAFKVTLASGVLFALTSCQNQNRNKEFHIITDHQILPPVMETVPVIEYSGIGIKYECENMFLHNCAVLQDSVASGKFCVRLIEDSSSATMKVKFPAGTYECLVKEKASDKNHSAFYISLDGIATRVYPRNPPSGEWELTTRVPVYFTLEESRTLTINITPHSDYEIGSTGMDLDYIQFVRR